jgi:Mrp family chromosome partitioning ATPase/LPS O-antigen subunit length determinant protein (WzzB/FepE family)
MTEEQLPRTDGVPGRFVRLLRENALLIAIFTVVFAAAGFLYSAAQKKVYQATASLLVQDPATELTSTASTTMTPAQLASAEAARVTRQTVAQRVKTLLGTSMTTTALGAAISTYVDPSSSLLLVTASADSPTLAANIANAFAREDAAVSTSETRAAFNTEAQAMQRQLSQLTSGSSNNSLARIDLIQRLGNIQALATAAKPVSVDSLATAPGGPSSPNTLRNTGILALLGLLVGIGVADLRRSRDHRFRDPTEIEDRLGMPLLGHVSQSALGHGGEANGHGEILPADLESVRILRQNLHFLDVDDGISSIVVTSALAEEGKSTVAALLAQASAAAGSMTLLIECDLRRPVLADRMGLAHAPGLADYLAGRAQPRDILQSVSANPLVTPYQRNGNSEASGAAPLVCITAGSQPRPPELLGSEKFRTFLNEVSAVYDAIILDTGPLLPVVDTLELVPLVDCVLLCVRTGKTTSEQANAAVAALRLIPNRPTGLVATGVTPRTDPYYTYYTSAAIHD